MSAIFTRCPGTSLYISAGTAAWRPFGFLSTVLVFDNVSLGDAWLDSAGVFFALASPLPDQAAPLLELALREWLVAEGWPMAGQRLLWVDFADPGSGGAFEATVLMAAPGGGAGPAALLWPVSFDLKGYRLEVPAGAMLSAGPAGNTLRIAGGAAFCAGSSPPMTYPVAQSSIAVLADGPNAGALTFAFDLTGGDDFASLEVGVRYGWAVGAMGVDYHHVPTIAQPAVPVRLWSMLQPFALDDPAASRFSLTPPDSASGPAPTLPSSYLTPEGRQIVLTPVAGGPTRPGGLVLARQPLLWSDGATVDAFRHYLTLDGDFVPGVAALPEATGALRILCGLGTLEYVEATFGAPLSFGIGPAFASPIGLTATATTARMIASANDVSYFSQPDAAPFYGNGRDPYLGFLEMAAAVLPAGTGWLPMLGHAGLDPALPQAETIEVETVIVAPARRAIIDVVGTTPPPITAVSEALTPQGLAIGLDPTNGAQWAWLAIASLTTTTTPQIAFVEVAHQFQQAVQSPGLFMALANANVVMAQASIGYCLTAAQFSYLTNHAPKCFAGYPVASLQPLVGVPFPDEGAFTAKVPPPPAGTPPEQAAEQVDFLCRLAGVMAATVDDWQFRFGPRTWPPAPADETSDDVAETRQGVMIVKLDTLLSIRQWLDRSTSWAWQPAAILPGKQIDATVTIIRDAIAVAEARYAADSEGSPYAHLLMYVVDNPAWVGMIVLNCDTPIDTLPGGLEAIAAGIASELFYAHHIGFEPGLVSIVGGKLQFPPATIFGAIDYRDDVDLVLQPDSPADFAFKARQLTVGFEQSTVATFKGRVELFVNRLFGATARKYPTEHGNVLPLDGVMLRAIGDDGQAHHSYRFMTTEENDYQLAGSALATVGCAVVSLGLSQMPAATGPIVSEFQIAGGMTFVATGDFDMFSYGPSTAAAPPADDADFGEPEMIDTPFGQSRLIGIYDTPDDADPAAPPVVPASTDIPTSVLAYEQLVVRMIYDSTNGTATTKFIAVIDDVAFNPKASVARHNGLAARFPARPQCFVHAAAGGPSPSDKGYVGADCGVRQGKLMAPWYGLEYDLSLGTLGALGDNVPIVITMLAAWSVSGDGTPAPVFFGVMLPGSSGDSFGINLQGVVKLGFGGIQFLTYATDDPTDPDGLGYAMRLRDFGLHIMGKQFPAGHIDVMLAGDPTSPTPAKLGWFAGYQAPDAALPGQNRTSRRTLAVRRAGGGGR